LMIRIAMVRQLKSKTESRLTAIAAALEQLHQTDNLGAYPPTLATSLNIAGQKVGQELGQPNDTNLGIESVYVVFRMKGITFRPQGVDDAVSNTDEDVAAKSVGTMEKADLFEYCDAYGNPFVYFNARDYKDVSKLDKYRLGAGGVDVKAAP